MNNVCVAISSLFASFSPVVIIKICVDCIKPSTADERTMFGGICTIPPASVCSFSLAGLLPLLFLCRACLHHDAGRPARHHLRLLVVVNSYYYRRLLRRSAVTKAKTAFVTITIIIDYHLVPTCHWSIRAQGKGGRCA